MPGWWNQGWPRKQPGSVAEAELLSQLGVLLMPDTPIGEMFRNFPAPEGWGKNYLEPDLTVHGALKEKDAALFVEYDGYWRHGEREGKELDQMKNEALLEWAPAGSCVVRISHTLNRLKKGRVLWVTANPWRRGNLRSLSKACRCISVQVLAGLGDVLLPKTALRLNEQVHHKLVNLSKFATDFTDRTAEMREGNTSEEIHKWLLFEGFNHADANQMQKRACLAGASIPMKLQPRIRWLSGLGLSQMKVAKAVATFPQILSYSIKQNVEPTVQWFFDLGLTKSQVAKAVATHPQILGLSIEQNLQPTMQWFFDLGLTKSQVVKAVATYPSILGFSIEQNLQPTVQWFLDLGLTKSQVAKAVATHPPVLRLSIEENLKPTVQWFLDLGLTKSQVAKAVAAFPALLGQSVDQNLQHKAVLLNSVFEAASAARLIADWPQILSYSYKRLTSRLSHLESQNQTEKLTSVMRLTDADFQRRFL